MEKVVITGGAGFIGSQLGYFLHNLGYDVHLIDDMSYGYEDNLIIDDKTFGKFYKMDVRTNEIESVLDDADYVFHFAGISCLPVCQSEPDNSMDINLNGTINVLEICRRKKIKKIIFASTSAVYENDNPIHPSYEYTPVTPDLIYSMSKYFAENVCLSYSKLYDMPISVMRFFNVYGPHQDFRRQSPPMIGYIIKCLMSNQSPVLHSTGNQARDYVYIDDLINLVYKSMLANVSNGKIINVCTTDSYSVNEIYSIIANEMDCSHIKPVFRESKLLWEKYDKLKNQYYNLSDVRIEKEVNKMSRGNYLEAENWLEWSPKISMEEGIKRTVKYCKVNAQ